MLTAAYILYKIIQFVFLGEFSKEKWAKIYDADHWKFGEDMATFELVTLVPLVFAMIFLGIWPSFLINTINATSAIILSVYQ